jgi:hypothetical protein
MTRIVAIMSTENYCNFRMPELTMRNLSRLGRAENPRISDRKQAGVLCEARACHIKVRLRFQVFLSCSEAAIVRAQDQYLAIRKGPLHGGRNAISVIERQANDR